MTVSEAKARVNILKEYKSKIFKLAEFNTTQGKPGWQTMPEVRDQRNKAYSETCREIEKLERALAQSAQKVG